MEVVEKQLLTNGIAWFDKWNSDASGEPTNEPSCYFESSDVPVASGHIHQARYFSGASSQALHTELEPGTALVCLHGFGAGVGIYYAALPALRAAWTGPVFALDWFGCSLSSRPKWTLGHGQEADPSEIERFFIEPLEQWRIANGVKRMVLLGHSKGGYLAGCYTARFPECVEHLILVSPAGVSGKIDMESVESPSLGSRTMDLIWNRAGINPLMVIWHLSPIIGRSLLRKFFAKFHDASWLERDHLIEYHYQSTLQGEISGGHALTGLLESGYGARLPLSRRLSACTSVAFVFGSRDHLFRAAKPGLAALKEATGEEPVVIRVAGAGHDLMVDNPLGFAEAVTAYTADQSIGDKIFGQTALARELGTTDSLMPKL